MLGTWYILKNYDGNMVYNKKLYSEYGVYWEIIMGIWYILRNYNENTVYIKKF